MAVIEVVTFRLASHVEPDEFLVADKQAATEFHYLQRGLLRRTTARGVDGQWLVVTLWASARDADAPNRSTALVADPRLVDTALCWDSIRAKSSLCSGARCSSSGYSNSSSPA